MNDKRTCVSCGRKMKQQFIGLKHCKCGVSWKKDIGYFERTSDMIFALERKVIGKKIKQVPVIRYKNQNSFFDISEDVDSTIRITWFRLVGTQKSVPTFLFERRYFIWQRQG